MPIVARRDGGFAWCAAYDCFETVGELAGLAGHREGAPWNLSCTDGARHIEKMRSVVARSHAARDDLFIGGKLAFLSPSLPREPCQRIEPMDGAEQLGDGTEEAIAPAHMGELMKKNDAPSTFAPGECGSRHEHRRNEETRQRRASRCRR